MEDQVATSRRVIALDLARTAAVLGMVIYHFTYDLDLFGYLPPRTSVTGGWAIFARIVAGSFLFLAGVNLWLAHGRGIRWHAFARRFLIVGGAAGLITVVTYLAEPERFVFFGILHSIAVATLISLAFLRLPVAVTFASAVAIIVAAQLLRSDIFNTPWLQWLGLHTVGRKSMDFVPVFPWLAPCLLGLALAKLASHFGWWDRLRQTGRAGRIVRMLCWPGRHSLAIYLAHQPVLIGIIWTVTQAIR